MADVTLTVEKAAADGLTPTRNSISTGNTYLVRNTGRVLLLFEKSGAGEATITIQTPKQVGGLAVAEQSVTVPASSGDVIAGPFPVAIYNNSDQDLKFSTDEGTGLTCAVVAL